MSIALLGFLPWTDLAREIAVDVNPSALAAESCATALGRDGFRVSFVPVAVSSEGIIRAREMLDRLEPSIVVALGQTPGGPRVERWGRVPGAWAPAHPDEVAPWLLAPDAEELATALAAIHDEAAQLEPFRPSEDAGAYFCDHLCVELARWMRVTGGQARFLHVTSIDGLPAHVRAARLRIYERQIAATVTWLSSRQGHGPTSTFPRRTNA